jgi:hypothetical protein
LETFKESIRLTYNITHVQVGGIFYLNARLRLFQVYRFRLLFVIAYLFPERE